MATIVNKPEDEEKEVSLSPTAQPTTTQPTNVSGGQSSTIGTGPRQVGPSQQTAKSGMFTNIKKYFEANQGAGQQLAEAAKGATGASQLGQAVEAKKQEYLGPQGVLGQKQTQATQAQQQAQSALGAATAPETITEQQKTQFQQALSGATPEGQKFTEYNKLNVAPEAAKAEQLTTVARQAQTEPGRFQLLRQAFATPEKQYTMGQSSLDAYLLGKSGAGKELAQDVTQQARDIQTNLAGLKGEYTVQEKALQDQVANMQTDLQQQYEEALAAPESNAKDRAIAAIKERAALIQTLQSSLENQKGLSALTPEQLQKLGITAPLTRPEIQLQNVAGGSVHTYNPTLAEKQLEDLKNFALQQGNIYGLKGVSDISEFLTGYDNKFTSETEADNIGTLARFMQPEEVARLQALQTLGGKEITPYDQSVIGTQFGEGISGVNLDIDKLSNKNKEAINNIIQTETSPQMRQNMFNRLWSQGGVNRPESIKLTANLLVPEFASEIDTIVNSEPNIQAYQNAVDNYYKAASQDNSIYETTPLPNPEEFGVSPEIVGKFEQLDQLIKERSGNYLSGGLRADQGDILNHYATNIKAGIENQRNAMNKINSLIRG